MKRILNLCMVLTLAVIYFTFFSPPEVTHAASHPYDVPTNIRNNWSNTYGDKTYSSTTGRKIIYDIYSGKHISGGYEIVNRNYNNKGTQPYIHFTGWSINFGRQHHTSSNHNTYIVAMSGSDVKIYSTIPINISATEDVEYNKQASTATTVYNRCGNSDRNKVNTTCNMEYDNVGFHAYLPLKDLFPSNTSSKSWDLYIVKEVNGHIVYTRLILPFNFNNLSYNTGQISLSSGVNANNLIMNATPVIKRTSVTDTSSSSVRGYFVLGNTYTRVGQNESSTTVWYQVRDPVSNSNRWASSTYWRFGGDQAKLTFTPEKVPPVHQSHSITGANYVSGNDYWVVPNKQITITLRQRDTGVGKLYQYIRLLGNYDIRSRHDFTNSSTTNKSLVGSYPQSNSHISIDSANRTENSNGYGKVDWKVTPKTHGHNYEVQWHYRDRAKNNRGYDTNDGKTNMRIRVDGVAPTLHSFELTGENYTSGNTYWVRPNTAINITLRQHDDGSGNKRQYLKFLDGNIDIRSWHNYQLSDTSQQQWYQILLDQWPVRYLI
ncbi:hypothetical protein [Bacillus kwashiorkori]|uniref:hypothetical protein n=1 Tax=Bacillus kwashiorkori TaxID=1522318 RepID=UPI00131A167B|nr:hypothetical protein [Bacillus kwashiorkori]